MNCCEVQMRFDLIFNIRKRGANVRVFVCGLIERGTRFLHGRSIDQVDLLELGRVVNG